MLSPVIASALMLGLLASPVSETLEPNYAERMLAPYENSDAEPRLWRPWKRFPLRVTVIDSDPYFNVARFQAIQRACGRWQRAVRGVSFIVSRRRSGEGSQIVFRFRKNEELEGVRRHNAVHAAGLGLCLTLGHPHQRSPDR
ncbi:hypothetical protein BH11ARM2_BH11ARM2_09510 [soil metagenome]